MIVGLGTDITSVQRIARLVHKYGQRFLDRAFHEAESSEFAARLQRAGLRDLSSATLPAAAAANAFLASRWAAKEALIKALQTERLLFPEVQVGWRGGRDADGKGAGLGRGGRAPVFLFHGEAASVITAAQVRVHLTMSHETDYAVATVLLEKDSPPPGTYKLQ